MREDNVIALLGHATNDLTGSEFKNIERQYKKALSEKNIPAFLQIDVKNFMENLRSALDYIAHDIYDVVLKPHRDRAGEKEIDNIYFPYGNTENDFKSRINSCLPKLQSLNPTIFELIEGIQPHKCKDDWLYQFCSTLNEKKHDRLSPQIKTERKTMTALAEQGSMTVPINDPNSSIQQSQNGQVTFGGVPVCLSNQGIEPLAPGLERIITTWVSFKFEGTDVDVLPLLKRALEEITTLSDKIYKELK